MYCCACMHAIHAGRHSSLHVTAPLSALFLLHVHACTYCGVYCTPAPRPPASQSISPVSASASAFQGFWETPFASRRNIGLSMVLGTAGLYFINHSKWLQQQIAPSIPISIISPFCAVALVWFPCCSVL